MYSLFTWENSITARTENHILEVSKDGGFSRSKPVPLLTPLGSFYTASTRTGNEPSRLLDLLGEADGKMRYARLRIE
jgi:hypothetical protein